MIMNIKKSNRYNTIIEFQLIILTIKTNFKMIAIFTSTMNKAITKMKCFDYNHATL